MIMYTTMYTELAIQPAAQQNMTIRICHSDSFLSQSCIARIFYTLNCVGHQPRACCVFLCVCDKPQCVVETDSMPLTAFLPT